MKVGDSFKRFSPLDGGTPAEAGKAVKRGLESVVGGAGKLLRTETARSADTFEKAAAPAFEALLGASRASLGGAAAAVGAVRTTISAARAELLGGLDSKLGRVETDVQALIRHRDEQSPGGLAVEGTGGRGGDLAATLLDAFAAAADALSQAQDRIAAEASLESTKEALASVEIQLKLILSQIEELRSSEEGEQDAAKSHADADPLAKAAQSVSDAYAAIRDLLEP